LLALGTFALALVVGCGPRFEANEPVDMVNDACCRVANDDMSKFAGCRPTGRCAKDEAIWMRGYISCSPVEEERCAGGRCCEYRPMLGSPDAVLHWDDSSGDDEKPPEEPTAQPPTEPAPEPQSPVAGAPAAGEASPTAAEPTAAEPTAAESTAAEPTAAEPTAAEPTPTVDPAPPSAA